MLTSSFIMQHLKASLTLNDCVCDVTKCVVIFYGAILER